MFDRIDIQTVTENALTVAFALQRPCEVHAVARSGGEEVAARTVERERVGTVTLDGLRASTAYAVDLWADDAAVSCGTVTTLPAPVGRLICSFAVAGDAHLCLNRNTHRGRLLPESPVLFREILHAARRRSLDFVLVPGDITNRGTRPEFELARELVGEAPCLVLTVPGDHDVLGGTALFEEYFGPTSWVRDVAGVRIVGCDTSRKAIGDAGFRHILESLPDPPGPTLFVSHLQLVQDDYIVDDDRAVADWARFRDEIVPRLGPLSVAYIGHKNVPSRVGLGGFQQFNTPQAVQYPCGWLYVRIFENGIYQTFEPLFSETLNEASRLANDALAVPKWRTEYRRGKSWEVWNCVVPDTLHSLHATTRLEYGG